MTNKLMTCLNKYRVLFTKLLNIFAPILFPAFIFYLQEFMLGNPIKSISPLVQIANIVFWIIVFLILLSIIGSVKAALLTEEIIGLIIGISNYYVVSFRSTPIQPWDFGSISVAASVAANYDYSLPKKIIILLVAYFALIIATLFITAKLPRLSSDRKPDNHSKFKIIFRIAMLICTVFLMISYVKVIQNNDFQKKAQITYVAFIPTAMTKKYGTPLTFILQCKYLKVQKPAEYDEQDIKDLLARYDTPLLNEGTNRPNIIVIMNEAYSNLQILQNFDTSEPVMPFTDSLFNGTENTQSGYLDVSVLGGNTANTEFEYLTGNTIAFLPQGSIPYQQYIYDDTDSIASNLKSQGYKTIAMHPYKAKGWNRENVYRYMGFDKFLERSDFDKTITLRKYISDEGDYKRLMEEFENKGNDPIFIFNVTMQNHGGYVDLYDNLPINIHANVDEKPIDDVQLNQYLTLINRSDKALEKLINYFSTKKEPVIVVFFGDHQPSDSVVYTLYSSHGIDLTKISATDRYNRYKVPFFIWANYDIEEKTNLVSSPGMLGSITLNIAGVKMTPYERFLLNMHETIQSVSSLQVTTNGEVFPIDEKRDILRDYESIQYYKMFDER